MVTVISPCSSAGAIEVMRTDGGVKLAHGGTQDVDGQKYEVLNISFDSVGLTPGDKYTIYIDPKEKLVRRKSVVRN